MPYPIATLPYPFRRRLRQLLSPAELYQLQIATGSLDDNKDLLPLQTCNFIENLVFEKDDTKIALIWAKSFAEKIKLSGNNLYNVKNVHLGNLNESTLSDLEFHNVVTTNIANLHIVGCEVTIHFLASLSRRKVKPTFLKIHSWSSLCTGTAKFSQLFEVFPTLEECSFKNFLMSGWVESMVDYGRTNLEVMSIWNSNFRIMVDFKPVKLYQFVKAQKNRFKLRLFYVNYQEPKVADVESKVLPLLKLYFNPSNFINRSIELVIQCQDKASSHYFTPR